jgi:NAD(P)-dependent dehydrogenase (short-subunit alcohol dehydrogenase family)
VQLEGKSVVITGSGSGVGRASALLFAAEGARVTCADVQDDWVKETVRQIEDAGGTAQAQVCNVTVESDVQAAIAAAVDSYGRLDVMFNNAGVSTPRPGMLFEEHTDADWDRLFDINLRGVFYGIKHAVLTFKAQGGGGSIVNTASVAGMVGWGGTVYGATKGGVIQLARGVAVEVAPFDIRVNCICPAGMPTTNFVLMGADPFADKDAGILEHVANTHPIGRVITPEDCAAAALFLASDAAHNITGVALPVDGGYIAR